MNELEASQRDIAGALGVSTMTVNRDLKEDVTNVTEEEESTVDNEEVTEDDVTNVTEEEEDFIEDVEFETDEPEEPDTSESDKKFVGGY